MKLHLSYSAEKTHVTVGNETVEVKPYQVVLWVSVSLRDMLVWDPRTARFPALLDPGNNHNFSITEEQLVKWAGIQPNLLEEQGSCKKEEPRCHCGLQHFGSMPRNHFVLPWQRESLFIRNMAHDFLSWDCGP